MSITVALVLSLGMKFWVLEDRVRANYVKEVEASNDEVSYREVTLFKEELIKERDALKEELKELGKLQAGVRRIDEYQQYKLKERQLDTFKMEMPQRIALRKEHAESQFRDADLSQMGLFLYMVETLFGSKGSGVEWTVNIFMFFIIFFIESWALVGAVRLRDGEYMLDLEFLLDKRMRVKKDNLEVQLKVEQNKRTLSEKVFGETSADELKRSMKRNQLQIEYAKLMEKQGRTDAENEYLYELIDRIKEEEKPLKLSSQGHEGALSKTLEDIASSNGQYDENFPPEFDYKS